MSELEGVRSTVPGNKMKRAAERIRMLDIVRAHLRLMHDWQSGHLRADDITRHNF